MAQGSAKLAKSKKSAGSQKRKAIRAKTVQSKGKKQHKPKKSSTALLSDKETTKAINSKNEAIVAAKAVGVGTRFFLSDVAEKGQKEMSKQLQERNKKQAKPKMTDRLKEQLKKLGKSV